MVNSKVKQGAYLKTIKRFLRYVFRMIIPIPIKVESGTSSYPHPIDVFRHMTNKFLTLNDSDEIKFQSDSPNKWVLLSWSPGDILVSINYKHKVPWDELFKQLEIVVPDYWVFVGLDKYFESFKIKRTLVFLVREQDSSSIASFLDVLFTKFYGCDENYIITGKTILKSTYAI